MEYLLILQSKLLVGTLRASDSAATILVAIYTCTNQMNIGFVCFLHTFKHVFASPRLCRLAGVRVAVTAVYDRRDS